MMLSLLFVLAAAAQSASHPVRWLADVAPPGRAALVARLAQPVKGSKVTLIESTSTGDKKIRTCAEYAAAKKRGWAPQDNFQIGVESFYREQCDVGALILAAKPSRESFLDGFALDSGALDRLPPSMAFILSGDQEREADEAERLGKSWKDFVPGLSVVETPSTHEIVVEEPDDARIHLRIKAFGDFDGDGMEDVLLFKSSFALHGTFHAFEPIILTRTSAGGHLRIVTLK